MKSTTIIAKIGGKIFESAKNLENTINQFKILLSKKIIKNVIIIPGGGSYANFIRKLDAKLKIGNDLSHWMAIFAMNLNGIAISQQYLDIKCVDNINELKDNKELMSIFLPFDFLYYTDELPHSWSVTSDSITLYIASLLELSECFLIKDVDGIFIESQSEPVQEISINDYDKLRKENKIIKIKAYSDDLNKTKPIDLYIIKLINDFKINCIILNGSFNSKRIIEFFDESKTEKDRVYTKIIK